VVLLLGTFMLAAGVWSFCYGVSNVYEIKEKHYEYSCEDADDPETQEVVQLERSALCAVVNRKTRAVLRLTVRTNTTYGLREGTTLKDNNCLVHESTGDYICTSREVRPIAARGGFWLGAFGAIFIGVAFEG
jgi:hypothetical protein